MTLNIISADNHVMEPPGTFVERVPAALKERVPRFVQALDGGEGWSWDGTPPASSPVPNTMGTGGTGWTWSQIPPGHYDGIEHLKDMALDGIDAAVFPRLQRLAAGRVLRRGPDPAGRRLPGAN